MMLNAYELLGVSSLATLEDIKEAYYRKARIHHPDSGGEAKDFIALKKAYELLKDDKTRTFMGTRAIFSPPSTIRLQPSLSKVTAQLFENLSLLQDRIKPAVNNK